MCWLYNPGEKHVVEWMNIYLPLENSHQDTQYKSKNPLDEELKANGNLRNPISKTNGQFILSM